MWREFLLKWPLYIKDSCLALISQSLPVLLGSDEIQLTIVLLCDVRTRLVQAPFALASEQTLYCQITCGFECNIILVDE